MWCEESVERAMRILAGLTLGLMALDDRYVLASVFLSRGHDGGLLKCSRAVTGER